MKKLHVLLLLDYYAPHIGGVETLFMKIVEGLLAEGYKVSIVTSRYDQQLAAVEHPADNCTIYRVGHNRFDFMRYGLRKANQLCHHKHVDIIHATTYMAAIPAGILKKITGLPTVLHVHEIYGRLRYRFLGVLGFLSITLEHIIFSRLRFDRYLCVSNYTKNNLRIRYGIKDKKLLTVYNAIDYEYRQPESDTGDLRKEYELDDKKIILFFGRPGVAKGLEDVIQSIPATVEENPSVHFVLIVPQDTKKKAGMIRATIDENEYDHILKRYADNITRIPGARGSALKQRMQTADLVVLPSHAEGFGFAIAEVGAMRKPLITTNIASIPEVVSGEVIFVEPANPQQLSDAMIGYFAGTIQPEIIASKKFLRSDTIAAIHKVYASLTRK